GRASLQVSPEDSHAGQRLQLRHVLGVPAIHTVGNGARVGGERRLSLLAETADGAIRPEPGQHDGEHRAQADVQQPDLQAEWPIATVGYQPSTPDRWRGLQRAHAAVDLVIGPSSPGPELSGMAGL